MQFVQGIFCPQCGTLLYMLERAKLGDNWSQIGAPLRKDARGQFLLCRACEARVPLRRARGLPGWDLEVDHDSSSRAAE